MKYGQRLKNDAINALLEFGCVNADQLLTLTAREVAWIPNVGAKGRAAIEAYRERCKVVSMPPQA